MDTSVLVAGITGFKDRAATNPSAILLREWVERGSFTWLITDEILSEYKTVLTRLRVRRGVIGGLINRLREEAETIQVRRSAEVSPDPDDEPFCDCSEDGRADFIVTLNPKDFPQRMLRAKVIAPGDAIPTNAGRRGQR